MRIFGLLLSILFACQSKQSFEIYIPAHFPDSINTVERNPLSRQGVDLGRQLFFDPILSAGNNKSCASCHFPTLAFADGKTKSVSNDDYPQRNSPALFNLAWYPAFFWDGGVKNLESLSFAPLTHRLELDMDLREMIAKLQRHSEYPLLFKKVFGTDSIQTYMVSRALAQYLRTLVSANSKWDSVQLKTATFNETEIQGQIIFNQYCASCHVPPLFTDHQFHQIGLDSVWKDEREEGLMQGRFRITRDSADMGKFKTPSLRNLRYTSPYMHDGRFATIEEVLEHYHSGVLDSENLSPLIKLMHFQLSEKKREHLMAFLNTLNDTKFIRDGVRDSLVVH